METTRDSPLRNKPASRKNRIDTPLPEKQTNMQKNEELKSAEPQRSPARSRDVLRPSSLRVCFGLVFIFVPKLHPSALIRARPRSALDTHNPHTCTPRSLPSPPRPQYLDKQYFWSLLFTRRSSNSSACPCPATCLSLRYFRVATACLRPRSTRHTHADPIGPL